MSPAEQRQSRGRVEAEQGPSTLPRCALVLDFQHPSGSLAKSRGPPNETHCFCFTFAVLGDEMVMDYFIVVTSVPDFFFQTHNRNIHLLY